MVSPDGLTRRSYQMVLPDGLTRRSYQMVLPDDLNQLTNFRTSFYVLEGCFLFYNIVSCSRMSFSCFRMSFSVLKHPFCFRTFYSVLEHPKNCKKLLKHCWKIVKKNVNLQKVQVARVWCVTCLKVPAHTHIAHRFEKSFRTHMHRWDRTSHLCMRARTLATHALQTCL